MLLLNVPIDSNNSNDSDSNNSNDSDSNGSIDSELLSIHFHLIKVYATV